MKTLVLKFIRRLGYEITHSNPKGLKKESSDTDILSLIEEVKTDLVLDIGANKGQFGTFLYDLGYNGKMISFEPILEMHKSLTEASSHNSL